MYMRIRLQMLKEWNLSGIIAIVTNQSLLSQTDNTSITLTTTAYFHYLYFQNRQLIYELFTVPLLMKFLNNCLEINHCIRIKIFLED